MNSRDKKIEDLLVRVRAGEMGAGFELMNITWEEPRDERGLLAMAGVMGSVKPTKDGVWLWAGDDESLANKALTRMSRYVEEGQLVRLDCGCFALEKKFWCLACVMTGWESKVGWETGEDVPQVSGDRRYWPWPGQVWSGTSVLIPGLPVEV